MKKYLFAFLAAAVVSLAACGGGGGGGYGGGAAGGVNQPPPGVGAMTIGFALPSGSIGTVTDATFGEVGGYTQKTYSQILAFPPGTAVTLKNLSTTTQHTLNVLSTSSFPANGPPIPGATPSSADLGVGYTSGVVNGNSTVAVTLSTAGTYYIGCAFHYTSNNMRDVLKVDANATPGPQATAQPGGGGGGGGGYGY